MKNNFNYMCALSGITDFYNPKKYRGRVMNDHSPTWMNAEESKAWHLGWNYAKNLALN